MDVSDIGSIATALGLVFAGWQIAAQRIQFRTSFQDTLWREQRDIIAEIPLGDALAGLHGDKNLPTDLSERDTGLMSPVRRAEWHASSVTPPRSARWC